MTSLRAYIITRISLTIPMILVLVTLVFVILRIMPGDPVRATIRPGSAPEYIQEIRHNLGLDKPLFLNFRGSWAEALSSSVVLRDGPSSDEAPALILEEGKKLSITDRVTTLEGDWVRLASGRGFEGLISPQRLDWLRRVTAGVKVLEETTIDDQRWVRVEIPGREIEGWAPVAELKIRTNIFDAQYFNYLFSLLRLDLGTSIAPVRGRSVMGDLKAKFPATLELSIFSMIITVLIGVFSGAYAAQKRRSVADYGFRIYSIVIYALPVFWLGLMLQLIFGVRLGWLPVYGRTGTRMAPETISGLFVLDSILTGNLASLISAIKHLILPSLTLGLYLSGIFTRLTRGNMLDVLQQDFITAARARGLPERVVVYKHALKNAFIPILTMIGLQFALLLAGAVLTETTFSWPGMGRFLVDRIAYRDFPSIQGGVVFFALLVTAVSLIVDIIYAQVDPRIRY